MRYTHVNLSNWKLCIPVLSRVKDKHYQHEPVKQDIPLTGIVSCFLADRKDSCSQATWLTITKSGMFLHFSFLSVTGLGKVSDVAHTRSFNWQASHLWLNFVSFIYNVKEKPRYRPCMIGLCICSYCCRFSHQSAVLHQLAWLSWSFHPAQRCTPPSAQQHFWLEAGDPLEAGTRPTVAVRGEKKETLRLRIRRDNCGWNM